MPVLVFVDVPVDYVKCDTAKFGIVEPWIPSKVFSQDEVALVGEGVLDEIQENGPTIMGSI
tara:strand:+ start:338 stop:520 length:183 start_codon:yes stop_codon:yes gene_type:complete